MKAIVAFDEAAGIGFKNKIPWHISEDFKWFKEQTLYKKILVGRKTADDLPPLPNRSLLVLSNKYNSDWMFFYDKKGNEYGKKFFNKEDFEKDKQFFDVVVCGGAQIYKEFLPQCDELFVTHVRGNYECDTWFPYSLNEINDMFPQNELIREFDGGHRVVRYSKS